MYKDSVRTAHRTPCPTIRKILIDCALYVLRISSQCVDLDGEVFKMWIVSLERRIKAEKPKICF